MKKIITICLMTVPLIASAQLRGSRGSKPLEPLLPFAEAVEKAKANDPQGWYALAIHYAKGDEIEKDTKAAGIYLTKAADANYGNAVLISTLLEEPQENRGRNRDPAFEQALRYIGAWYIGAPSRLFDIRNKSTFSFTNDADVARIRTGYERAFKLGVSAATNELARFERKVESKRNRMRKAAERAATLERNSELASSLLDNTTSGNPEHENAVRGPANASLRPRTLLSRGGKTLQERRNAERKQREQKDVLRKRLNDPDADNADGRKFLWEAGGKEGFTFDVLIRVREGSTGHCIEKATITIDKDGKIIKVEGKPGVTEI